MQICLSNLLPGLRVKSKFQTATFFSVINHGRGSIGGTFTANVSLIPPVWTKIHSHYKNLKILLQAIDAANIIIATFTTKLSNENMCHFVNLQCSFSYNFNSLMHLWDRVSYF